MSGLEYFTSERFIHDDLLAQAEDGIPSLYESWKAHRKIEPFAITWPEGPVRGDDGSVIEGHVVVHFESETPEQRKAELLQAVKRTRAYAFLLAEQSEDEVLLIFESRHGTKSWSLAIKRHGPDRVLGDPVREVDKHYVGLLWRPASSPKR